MIILYIFLAVIAGVLAAACATPADWLSSRSVLLVAFGIQGAAILTRLGRGHPVSDVNHLTLEQLEKLNKAVGAVANEQRNAALVTFTATLSTIGINSAQYLAHEVLTAMQAQWISLPVVAIDGWLWRVLIFATVFLIVAAFCHLPSIILQDISLIKLQSQFKREALEAARKKSAKENATKADLMLMLDEINSSLRGGVEKVGFGRIVDSGKKD